MAILYLFGEENSSIGMLMSNFDSIICIKHNKTASKIVILAIHDTSTVHTDGYIQS